MSCQVKDCEHSLQRTVYHKRYRICDYHATLNEMVVNGKVVRFCQQCGRFQDLSEFDGLKKSCRRKLYLHNAQRKRKRELKKVQKETETPIPTLRSTRERQITTTNPSTQGTSNFTSLETRSISMGQAASQKIHESGKVSTSYYKPVSCWPTPEPDQETYLDGFDIDAVLKCLEEQDVSGTQHEYVMADQRPMELGPISALYCTNAVPPVTGRWSMPLSFDPLRRSAAPSADTPAMSWIPQNLPRIASYHNELCNMSQILFTAHPSELPVEVHDALEALVSSARMDISSNPESMRSDRAQSSELIS